MPLLGIVDDILAISESGSKTSRLNAFINAKTAVKRLQFGPDKCHVMHVGIDIPNHKKMNLYVDGWQLHEVQSKNTHEIELQETFDGEHGMEESGNEKYLGQIISNDGSNVKNVAFRAGKGTGMVNIVENIIKNVPGGKYHFEIAVILRNAYLISSMLSCSEVWYSVTEGDLRKLEQVDEKLLRKILNCSFQVTNEMLYLELGLLPVRYIIKLRRLIYLKHVLKQEIRNSLIYQFLIAQVNTPKRKDWASTVLKDLEEIDIKYDFVQIKNMPDITFEKLCKENIHKQAFQYLDRKKLSHEKVKHIEYKKLEMAGYLKPTELQLSTKDRQFLFQCRVSDIDVKSNRKWKYSEKHCVSCQNIAIEEMGLHILECKILSDQNDQISYIPEYEDLFGKDIEEQIYTSRMMQEHMKIRKVIIEAQAKEA